MCKFKFRFLIALLTFVLGLTSVWIYVKLYSYFTTQQAHQFTTERTIESPSISEIPVVIKQESSKPEIRFKKFKKVEGETVAEFELVNNSSEPISYSGYGKDSYCTLLFDNGTESKIVRGCYCGTGLSLQTLYPGETAVYTVYDNFAPFNLTKMKKVNVSGKFGFKILVGTDKREEIIWSEQITFPD